MIGPRKPGDRGDSVDLQSVTRDDQLLDQLAAGAHLTDSDPVIGLLQALVREVDADLTVAAGVPLPAKEAEQPGTRWLLGRNTLRGTVAAVVVGVGLSVSGVSAAVTGDPFAAYESVAGVFDASDELPPNAADIARFNKRMVAARSAVRAGDETQAQARIDALRDMLDGLDLKPQRRAALERRLAALEAQLADGPAKGRSDGADEPGSTSGKPGEGTGQGRSGAPGQQDKAPSTDGSETQTETGSENGTTRGGATGNDNSGDKAGDRTGDKPSAPAPDKAAEGDDESVEGDGQPAGTEQEPPTEPAAEPATPDQGSLQQQSDNGAGQVERRR